MIRRESLPPFTFALSAVALAIGAVLLPYVSGGVPSRISQIHISVADATLSVVLAVSWVYAASRVHGDGMRSQVVLTQALKYYGPVTALFALYMIRFHPNARPFRSTAIFLLSILLCEVLWNCSRNLSNATSRRTLVLGTGRLATTVWRDLRTGRLPDLSFAGFTGERYREEYCPDIAARYIGDISGLKEIVLEQSIEDLIVATPPAEGSAATELAVEVAANLGVRVWAVRQALGVPDYAVENNAADYIELVAAPRSNSIKGIAKRALDLAISASVLIVGFPFAVMIVIREKALGRNIYFDRQARVGLHRHLFQIRRAHSNAGSDLLCELLNKYLLMWNVFRGEMSMVGPSALSPEDLANREIPEALSRFGIRPGLTGGSEFEADRDICGPTGRRLVHADQRPLGNDLVVLFRAARAFVQRNTTTHVESGAL